MRKFVYTHVTPMSIDRLVEICTAMKGMSHKDAIAFGANEGISKHNVDAIRQMLGYSQNDVHHLSAEEREAIAAEYKEGGTSMMKLAKEHGVHYNSIRCIIINRDVDVVNPRLWTKRMEYTLLNELKHGKDAARIADEMGKSKRSIVQKIERMKKEGRIK